MSRLLMSSVFVCLILHTISAFSAQLYPNPYGRAGIQDNRPMSWDIDSVAGIDTLSGRLNAMHTDGKIVGVGPDISIIRNLNSRVFPIAGDTEDFFSFNGLYGKGWDITFGRLFYGGNYPSSLCGGLPEGLPNPTFTLPGGSWHKVFRPNHQLDIGDYPLIADNLWVGDCLPDNKGFVFRDDNGTQYYFDHNAYSISRGAHEYFLSRIVDVHDNVLTVDYITWNNHGRQYELIDRVSATDGRFAQFHYEEFGNYPKLTSIDLGRGSNARETWTYNHIEPEGIPNGHTFLDSVEGPESYRMAFDYYYDGEDPQKYQLRQIQTPFGGTHTFTYKKKDRWQIVLGSPSQTYSVVVGSRAVSGPDVESATWSYDYFALDGDRDVTTVRGPVSIERFTHCGSRLRSPDFTLEGLSSTHCQFNLGSLITHEVFELSNEESPVQKTEYEWIGVGISREEIADLATPYDLYYTSYPKSFMRFKSVTRDGVRYNTAYTDFDYSALRFKGLAEAKHLTAEYDQIVDMDSDKRFSLSTLYHDKSDWVIREESRRIYDQVINYRGATYQSGKDAWSWDFYSSGEIKDAYELGYKKSFTYNSDGTLDTVLDPHSMLSKSFDDYENGLPRTITTNGASTLNDYYGSGYIKTSEDPLGNLTTYHWDDLGRITDIETPRQDDLNIHVDYSFNARTKTLTRGSYTHQTTYDGFGRVVEESNGGITTYYDYDAAGRLTFTSDLNDRTNGVITDYDVLGRVESKTYSKNNARTRFEYSKNVEDQVTITDAELGVTKIRHERFGDPGENRPIKIEQLSGTNQQPDVVTNLTWYLSGYPLMVNQGNLSRLYIRDESYRLVNEQVSDLGLFTYEYFDGGDDRIIGNLEKSYLKRNPSSSESVTTHSWSFPQGKKLHSISSSGQNIVTQYDELNRVELINRPGAGTWKYNFDPNGNLDYEAFYFEVGQVKDDLNGNGVRFDYSYNSLDYRSNVTYPSGLSVALNPNVLGWPQRVGDFITNVSYFDNGIPEVVTYGNGRSVTYTRDQDNPSLVDTIKVPNLVDLDYDYDLIGNMRSILDSVVSNNSIVDILYDDIGRLTSSRGSWGESSYRYTNSNAMREKNVGAQSYIYSYGGETEETENYVASLLAVSGDRQVNFTYDVLGNVTQDDNYRYKYSGFSELGTLYDINDVDHVNPLREFLYDGKKNRVYHHNVLNDEVALSLYGMSNKLLWESNEQRDEFSEYLYLGSKLVAKRKEVCDQVSADADGDGLADCYERKWWGAIDQADDTYDDGDGLSPSQEFLSNTSPLDADTDSDGINDDVEVAQGFDPLNSDEDSDGIQDGLEYEHGLTIGLNDYISDKDGDGYPDYYEVLYGNLDWVDDPSLPNSGGGRICDVTNKIPAIYESVVDEKGHLYALGHDIIYSLGDLKNPCQFELSSFQVDWEFPWKISRERGIYRDFSYHGLMVTSANNLSFVKHDVTADSNSLSSRIVTVNADNGNLISESRLFKEITAYGYTSTGDLIVQTSHALHKLNELGGLDWSYSFSSDIRTNKSSVPPLIRANGSVVIAVNQNVYSISSDGSLEWQLSLGQKLRENPMSGSSGELYVIGGNDLYAITPDGFLKWERNIGGIFSIGKIHGDRIHVVSNSMFSVLDLDGEPLWEREISSASTVRLLVDDNGDIYLSDGTILDRDGVVLAGGNHNVSGYSMLTVIKDGFITRYGRDIQGSSRTISIGYVASEADQVFPGYSGENGYKGWNTDDLLCSKSDLDLNGIPDCIDEWYGINESNIGVDLDGDGLDYREEYLNGSSFIHSDYDNDGLDDGVENSINTDPNSSDTDKDGINDRDEYITDGLNPLVSDIDLDSDGDGFSNAQEFLAGTGIQDDNDYPQVTDIEGEELWRIPLTSDLVSIGYPAASHDEGKLYYTYVNAIGENCLVAISTYGSTLWSNCFVIAEQDAMEDQTNRHPVVGPNGDIYIAADNLYAFDGNGDVKWTFQLDLEQSHVAPAISVEGDIYVIGKDTISSLEYEQLGNYGTSSSLNSGSLIYDYLSSNIDDVNEGSLGDVYRGNVEYLSSEESILEELGNSDYITTRTLYRLSPSGELIWNNRSYFGQTMNILDNNGVLVSGSAVLNGYPNQGWAIGFYENGKHASRYSCIVGDISVGDHPLSAGITSKGYQIGLNSYHKGGRIEFDGNVASLRSFGLGGTPMIDKFGQYVSPNLSVNIAPRGNYEMALRYVDPTRDVINGNTSHPPELATYEGTFGSPDFFSWHNLYFNDDIQASHLLSLGADLSGGSKALILDEADGIYFIADNMISRFSYANNSTFMVPSSTPKYPILLEKGMLVVYEEGSNSLVAYKTNGASLANSAWPTAFHDNQRTSNINVPIGEDAGSAPARLAHRSNIEPFHDPRQYPYESGPITFEGHILDKRFERYIDGSGLEWIVDDELVATGSTLTLEYAENGIHEVIQKWVDSSGKQSALKRRIVYIDDPSAEWVGIWSPYAQKRFRKGIPVKFATESTGALPISWHSTREGNIELNSSGEYSFKVPGWHRITATKMDGDQAVSTSTVEIEVFEDSTRFADASYRPSITLTSPQTPVVSAALGYGESSLGWGVSIVDWLGNDISDEAIWTTRTSGYEVIGTGANPSVSELPEGLHKVIVEVSGYGDYIPSASFDFQVGEISSEQPGLTVESSHSSIAAGGDLTLTGQAIDHDGGALNPYINWYSNLDGYIGRGSEIVLDDLTAGSHQIQASVVGTNGVEVASSLSVMVGANVQPKSIRVLGEQGPLTILVGASLELHAEAESLGGDDISDQINWSSSISGALGSGSTVLLSNLNEGSHLISATIGDVSAPVHVTVATSVPYEPAIKILSPSEGQYVKEGEPLKLVARIEDFEGYNSAFVLNNFNANAANLVRPSSANASELESTITWELDNAGIVGQGPTVTLEEALSGEHTLTATAELNHQQISFTRTIKVNERGYDDEREKLSGPFSFQICPGSNNTYIRGSSALYLCYAERDGRTNISSDLLGITYQFSSDVDGIVSDPNMWMYTKSLSPGKHEITLTGIDGEFSYSTSQNIVVEDVSPEPSIDILQPRPGQVLPAGVPIPLIHEFSSYIGYRNFRGLWSVNGDASSGMMTNHSYREGVEFTPSSDLVGTDVTLIVRDHASLYSDYVSASVDVQVSNDIQNSAPELSISFPPSGSSISRAYGSSLLFNASLTDAEDGDISSAIEWYSSIDGRVGEGSGIRGLILSPGMHLIRAIGQDSDGVMDMVERIVNIYIPSSDTTSIYVHQPVNKTEFGQYEEVFLRAMTNQFARNIQWSSSIDGDIGWGHSINKRYLSVGAHEITASIIEDNQIVSSDTIQITITENPDLQPPTVSILTPIASAIYQEGDYVHLTAEPADDKDENLLPAVRWQSSRLGVLGSGQMTMVARELGEHEITAVVIDSDGLEGSSSIVINVIEPSGSNHQPVVNIESPLDDAGFQLGSTVTFRASATDVEDDDLSSNIIWISSIDGDLGSGAVLNINDLSLGEHIVTARVVDSNSAIGTSEVTITVRQNAVPVLNVTSPSNNSTFNVFDNVEFNATAIDNEDGDISELIVWSSNVDGELGVGGTLSTDILSVGTHQIIARIEDSSGAPDMAQVIVVVEYPFSSVGIRVYLNSPKNNSSYNLGDAVVFRAASHDLEDGDISSAISWRSSLDGDLGVGSMLTIDTLSLGDHQITAEIQDSDGNRGVATSNISILGSASADLDVTTAKVSDRNDAGIYKFNATVTNNGPNSATNVQLVMDYPYEVASATGNTITIQSAVPAVGNCTSDLGSCNLGSLESGASVRVDFTGHHTEKKKLPHKFSASSNEDDPNAENNTSITGSYGGALGWIFLASLVMLVTRSYLLKQQHSNC